MYSPLSVPLVLGCAVINASHCNGGWTADAPRLRCGTCEAPLVVDFVRETSEEARVRLTELEGHNTCWAAVGDMVSRRSYAQCALLSSKSGASCCGGAASFCRDSRAAAGCDVTGRISFMRSAPDPLDEEMIVQELGCKGRPIAWGYGNSDDVGPGHMRAILGYEWSETEGLQLRIADPGRCGVLDALMPVGPYLARQGWSAHRETWFGGVGTPGAF
jgi:hypothetical protein